MTESNQTDSAEPGQDVIAMLGHHLALSGQGGPNRRSKERLPLQLPCKVFVFVESTSRTRTFPAVTRDVSSGGLGVFVKACLHPSSPIEVRIEPPGERPVFVGGLVRFCRYLTEDVYEVGIELLASAKSSIFAERPAAAMSKLPWLAAALNGARKPQTPVA